jgi:hypothetical protein
MSVASYKRRVFIGAQCGVKTIRQAKPPEADNTAEDLGSVEGEFDYKKPWMHLELEKSY